MSNDQTSARFPDLPLRGKNNLWYRYNESDAVVVFVHGVLSDSRACWLNDSPQGRVFWPDLITYDKRFKDPAIYLAGYYTDVDSGPYDIRACAEEIFGALRRVDPIGRPPALNKQKITFICHSTGGLVVRYMLEHRFEDFAAKEIGLVLIASPSSGSRLANRLDLIARFYNHKLGGQLKWANWSLDDLDDRFKELLKQERIPKLRVVEFYENHFIVHSRWLPFFMSKYVVDKESAGHYIGAPKLLRNTDHFSAVKPATPDHPAHQYLLDFMADEDLLPAMQNNSLWQQTVFPLRKVDAAGRGPTRVRAESGPPGRSPGRVAWPIAAIAVAIILASGGWWLGQRRGTLKGFIAHFIVTVKDVPIDGETTIEPVDTTIRWSHYSANGIKPSDDVAMPAEGWYRFLSWIGPKLAHPLTTGPVPLPKPIFRSRTPYKKEVEVKVTSKAIPVQFSESDRLESNLAN